MKTIGIIGGGNMGEAILSAICSSFKVCVAEKVAARCCYLARTYRVRTLDVKSLAAWADILILAVKPQDIDEALDQLHLAPLKKKLVISIAAGIPIAYLEKKLGQSVAVVRTMPNLPAQIRQGMTALARGRYASARHMTIACEIFDHLGQTVVVSENLIDAVTAISGSGPGYVYLFIEEMIKAAKALGLSDAAGEKLVVQTFKGSVDLLVQKKIAPALLRAKVTSKGGTTQAGLEVFMKRGIGKIFKDATKAAKKRAKQLSRKK